MKTEEFDGEVTEIGLGGIVIKFKNELRLWDVAVKVTRNRKVHVILEIDDGKKPEVKVPSDEIGEEEA